MGSAATGLPAAVSAVVSSSQGRGSAKVLSNFSGSKIFCIAAAHAAMPTPAAVVKQHDLADAAGVQAPWLSGGILVQSCAQALHAATANAKGCAGALWQTMSASCANV